MLIKLECSGRSELVVATVEPYVAGTQGESNDLSPDVCLSPRCRERGSVKTIYIIA